MTQETCTWNPETQIAIIWDIEDVQSRNNGLTDEQAFDVLIDIRRFHDCNYGITWDTIDFHIEDIYPDVKHAEVDEDE